MDEVTTQVMQLLDHAEQQTQAFQQATGLHCPFGCGRCCENPQVEVTILDCLPLAVELFRQDKVEQWWPLLVDRNNDRCVFYQPDPDRDGQGRCQVYPWRPLLCRLFGFATVNTKQGEPELAACVEHKATQPETVAQCQTAIAAGLPAPNFRALTMQLAAIDPTIGTARWPINQAMQQALERVGLKFYLTTTESESVNSPDPDIPAPLA